MIHERQWYNLDLIIYQLKELQSVLHDKYGAFSTVAKFEHKDLEDSERSFSYVVEDFMKENDSRKNLLLIFYSGCSEFSPFKDVLILTSYLRGYVHQGQLFLEPHQNTEPTVQWTDYVDRRILPAVAKVLLVFDTTKLRQGHYTQMFKETGKRLDKIGYQENQNVLGILAIDGSETSAFTSSLAATASAEPNGFTISKLCDTMNSSQQASSIAARQYTIIKNGSGGTKFPRIVLLPLARPKLQLYGHHSFSDPHNEYLQDYKTIHRDGSCRVIKLSLGPDRQQFSPTVS